MLHITTTYNKSKYSGASYTVTRQRITGGGAVRHGGAGEREPRPATGRRPACGERARTAEGFSKSSASDFDDEGAAKLVGDLGGLVEAGAAVEAFGEGVIDGEADIGGGVWLGLLHDPEIAALPG
jgi:hypothetical protein